MTRKYEITLTLTRTKETNEPVIYKYIKEGEIDWIIRDFKEQRFARIRTKKQATLINLEHVSEINIIEIE